MKKNILSVVLVCGIFFFASCKTGSNSAKLNNELDSVSYSLGVSIAQNLKMNGLDEVNSAAFSKGIEDFLKNEKPQIDPMMADQIINNYLTNVREKESEKALKEGEDFLAKNKEKSGIQTTDSGLQYEIIEKGSGATPDENDMVTVHYTGKTINGNVFDSSVERGEPVTFGVGQVIPGWTEGLQMMQEGGKARFYIPSELGYGARGAGPDIPPHSALIFDVELISVEKTN
jgi:FKBP-type peptidyl-prolyl cis-trans isomerase FklB